MSRTDDEGESSTPEDRIRSYVPGMLAYGNLGDMRDADRMVRMQVSQKLSLTRKNFERTMEIMEGQAMFEEMRQVDSLLNTVKRLSADVGYASQATSLRRASDPSAGEEYLRRLQFCDTELLDRITNLIRISGELAGAVERGNASSIFRCETDLRTGLGIVEDLTRRRQSILGE